MTWAIMDLHYFLSFVVFNKCCVFFLSPLNLVIIIISLASRPDLFTVNKNKKKKKKKISHIFRPVGSCIRQTEIESLTNGAKFSWETVKAKGVNLNHRYWDAPTSSEDL